ncbi:hypothetical protein BaRGS_00028857 [Batillaria attramentaria]|uniref:Uncharacterized protein n=1 Tax=Batillaria attramentaria TaxID=370345 RepID=A0ABD0JYS7_9CAEN
MDAWHRPVVWGSGMRAQCVARAAREAAGKRGTCCNWCQNSHRVAPPLHHTPLYILCTCHTDKFSCTSYKKNRQWLKRERNSTDVGRLTRTGPAGGLELPKTEVCIPQN